MRARGRQPGAPLFPLRRIVKRTERVGGPPWCTVYTEELECGHVEPERIDYRSRVENVKRRRCWQCPRIEEP